MSDTIVNTKSEINSRRGQLLEMATTLSNAKSLVDSVMQDYPHEAYGSGWLEEAIGLIGRAENEIDNVADDADE